MAMCVARCWGALLNNVVQVIKLGIAVSYVFCVTACCVCCLVLCAVHGACN